MAVETEALARLLALLDRLCDEHPDLREAALARRRVEALLGAPTQKTRPDTRAEELADLRRVPLGNALFTRDGFEAEFGPPELAGAPRLVSLEGEGPANTCVYCDGERFTVETYATDRPGTHVRFWWCHACGLGHAVSWGALD
jgi:hypothetical protein